MRVRPPHAPRPAKAARNPRPPCSFKPPAQYSSAVSSRQGHLRAFGDRAAGLVGVLASRSPYRDIDAKLIVAREPAEARKADTDDPPPAEAA